MKNDRFKKLFALSAMSLLLTAPISTSHADSTTAVDTPKGNGKAILVLDASGSMWGKIDGKTKIEIAKSVVSTTVKDWTDSVDLGLIAYGHNRKSDCSDIEMLIEPSKLDAEAFIAKANKLNPKGKTPLTAAVKQAAEALKYSEAKATVILVSDGKETCDLDPCKVGEKLEDIGVDFTAHVIGFDVSIEDSVGLRCLAEKTGGVYLDAKNAEDLQEAMNATREATVKAEPEPDAIDYGQATLIVPDEVIAGSEFSVEWTGPQNENDHLIIRSEDPEFKTNSFSNTRLGKSEFVSPTIMKAPEKVGKYVVHYEVNSDHSIGQAILKVVPPKVTVDAPKEVSAGSEFEVTWSGPLNEGDDLRLFKATGEKIPAWVSLEKGKSVSPSIMKAPVELGDYEIHYVGMHGQSYAKTAFTVTEVEASVDAPDSVAAGSVFKVEWTGPRNEFDRIRIIDTDGNKKLKFASVDNENAVSPALLTAPVKPGKYTVSFWASDRKQLAEDTFIVTEISATIDAPESVEADSKFLVNWTGPKYETDQLRIYSLDGKNLNRRAAVGKKGAVSPILIRAPRKAGQYEIRYVTKGSRVLTTEKVTVTEKN